MVRSVWKNNYSCRSILFPHATITVFSPLFCLNNSIQLYRFSKVSGPALSGVVTVHIEYENGTNGIFEVAGDETSVAFLAGGVPELEAAGVLLMGDIFADKVDSDGGLR